MISKAFLKECLWTPGRELDFKKGGWRERPSSPKLISKLGRFKKPFSNIFRINANLMHRSSALCQFTVKLILTRHVYSSRSIKYADVTIIAPPLKYLIWYVYHSIHKRSFSLHQKDACLTRRCEPLLWRRAEVVPVMKTEGRQWGWLLPAVLPKSSTTTIKSPRAWSANPYSYSNQPHESQLV